MLLNICKVLLVCGLSVSCVSNVSVWSSSEFQENGCMAKLTPGTVEDGLGSVMMRGFITPNMVETINHMEELPHEIIFYDSPGGSVTEARKLIDLGIPIRIDGETCASACTMILIESSQACISESIKTITFHSVVFRQCTGNWLVTKVDDRRTKNFINKIRNPLRGRLQSLVYQEDVVDISTEEFLEHYPEKLCQ